jgi:DNA-binding response OmpR family regulator
MMAVLRRQIRNEKIVIGDYSLDMLSKTLFLNDVELEVTPKAVELLMLLMQSNGSIVKSDDIKNRLWAAGQNASDGSLRVYITQLKKYFSSNIVNVRGIGYRWEA